MSNTETEVEIEFEDCAVPVGTQLKMTALVVPENTDQALIWSSSDSSVAEIDKDGILTVKAVGTTVVTATVGTVSDSVVIEGIENVAQGSKNNLPVYTGTTLAKNNASGSGSASGSTSSGGTSAGSGSDSGSTGTGGGQAGGSWTGSGSSGSGSYDGGSGDSDSDGGDDSGSTDSGSGSSGGSSNGGSGTTIHPQTAGIPQTTVIAAVTPAMVTTAAAFQTDFQESDLHSVIPMFMYAKKMIHIMEKSSHSRM